MKICGVILLTSCTLLLTACSHHPPCNREDVTVGKDGSVTVNKACWSRIMGDLDTCYKQAK